MNRIVREHYPVSRLPEDLREGIDPAADVVVIVEEIARPADIMTLDQIFASRRPPFLSKADIDGMLREQRDEWDD